MATKKGSSVAAFKKGLGRMLNSKPEEKMPAKNLRPDIFDGPLNVKGPRSQAAPNSFPMKIVDVETHAS